MSKIEYPPDKHLSVEDYAKALNARNTTTKDILDLMSNVYTTISWETAEMEEPMKACDHHPILCLYLKELAFRVSGYVSIPHDDSNTFCAKRLYALENCRDLFIDRLGFVYRSNSPSIARVTMPVTKVMVEEIERLHNGVVTNFDKEAGRLYV